MVDVINMAHFKVPRRLKKSKFRPLNLANVTCPVCLSILVEPVTMPCNHELCMPCFQQTLNESSLTCPMCRMRFSSWARKAARENSLINHKKWHEIKKSFPEKVNKRLKGLDDGLDEDPEYVTVRSLSAPGEIRKEFEEQLKMWQEEKEKQKKLEQESFLMLLKSLQYEKTEQQQQLQQQQQQQIQLQHHHHHHQPQQQMNELIEFSSFPKSIFATNADELNVCPQINGCEEDSEVQRVSRGSHSSTEVISRSESTDSNDSITQELCHFKPIKIAPKTPPKQLPDGRIEEPLLIVATPRNLRKLSHANESSLSVSSCLPLCHKLSLIEADRSSRVAGKISQATETESSMFAKSNVPSELIKESVKPILPLEPNLPLADQTSTYHPSFAFSELNFTCGYSENDNSSSLTNIKTRSSSRDSRKSSTKSERSVHSVSFQDPSSSSESDRSKKLKIESATPNSNSTSEALDTLSCSSKTSPVVDTKEIVAEQELIMERFKQEEVDRQIAYKLQQQFDLENQTLHRMGVREPYKLRKRLTSNYRLTRKQY